MFGSRDYEICQTTGDKGGKEIPMVVVFISTKD